MHIYNSKIIFYATLLSFSLFSFDFSYNKNKENMVEIPYGETVSNQKDVLLPLISNQKTESKSTVLRDVIFTPIKTDPKKINQNTTPYLINIFCTQSHQQGLKVVSGSGVFLSKPSDNDGFILTNAHVARHLLDLNKKCVGRTGSPALTTHTLILRYIPSQWLNEHSKYITGDLDQSSTGEYDFAIIETKKIKPSKKDSNIYSALEQSLKLKMSNYNEVKYLDNTYIYSYPAQSILSKNINNSIYQKKDLVSVLKTYSSPKENIEESLLDVTGSRYIEQGSSGGMVISQGLSNSIIGLSSVLIKNNYPQTVRVVTIKHILSTIQKDIEKINTAQTDPFLYLIKEMLNKKEIDISLIQILKNSKLTSSLEEYTKNTLVNINVLKK